jgi:S-formylglutathione hydrolase
LPPVLYYLSGITCTDDNARTKSNYLNKASEYRIAVVFPDTSPRDVNVEGAGDSWSFGYGAGFYVDATEEKYKTNFNMYTYVNQELPDLINRFFSVDKDRKSVTGHSMGGHGAIILALRNPGAFKSVSAFSPICNPTQASWG